MAAPYRRFRPGGGAAGGCGDGGCRGRSRPEEVRGARAALRGAAGCPRGGRGRGACPGACVPAGDEPGGGAGGLGERGARAPSRINREASGSGSAVAAGGCWGAGGKVREPLPGSAAAPGPLSPAPAPSPRFAPPGPGGVAVPRAGLKKFVLPPDYSGKEDTRGENTPTPPQPPQGWQGHPQICCRLPPCAGASWGR